MVRQSTIRSEICEGQGVGSKEDTLAPISKSESLDFVPFRSRKYFSRTSFYFPSVVLINFRKVSFNEYIRNKLEYYFTSLLGVGRILSRLKILASFCCVGPPKVETLVALFCDKNVYFPGDFSLILKLI
jgi:hypothetical protein